MIVRVLHRLEEGIIALLLVGMVLVAFLQVILRYIFGTGIDWGLELTFYMFGWLVIFGASFAVKEGCQLGIDVLVVKLAPARRRAVGLLVAAACLVYAAIFFEGGWEVVAKMLEFGIEGDDIPIQRWILQSGIPIGFALLFLRFCQIAWRIWIGKDPGFRLGDEFREVLGKNPAQAD